MRGRTGVQPDYEWPQAEADLADGVHPEVVAARIGEPIDLVLKVAGEQRWPIRWAHVLPTAEVMLERFSRLYGFDA
jgi:hypothetical protein